MSPGPRIPRPAAAALLLCALGLAGCQGSDPQPLSLVSRDAFGGSESLVDGGGGGATLGFGSPPVTGPTSVRLLRLDAADPDLATLIGDVPLGGRATRLRVTDEAVAALVGGALLVADAADPALLPVAFEAPEGAADLAVRGRWIAVAANHALHLLDREGLAAPASYPTTATPTAPVATAWGFLCFTATGWVTADVTGPTPAFREVADPLLRDARAAAALPGGAGAWVAGPGGAADRARVLRLDLSDPAAPVVLRSADLAGAFVAFAWDGGEEAVLAVHGEGDDPARPESFHEGWLLRESAGGLAATRLPLPFWSRSAQPFALHARRLLAAQPGGVTLLRLR